MKPGDLYGNLAAAEDLRQVVDNVGAFVVHPDAFPGHPRDVTGAADAADRLTVDERIVEGAWPVEAHELRLERARVGPVRLRGPLHHPRVPIVCGRRLKVLTGGEPGAPTGVLGDFRARDGVRAGRESRVVGDLELVRPGAALVRRAVDDRQRGPGGVELCAVARGIGG